MQTKIEETFEIEAPIEEVWAFLMDPHRVVECMPGGELDKVVDDNTFLGTIKLKLGFVTVSYQVEARFTEVDPNTHLARLEAKGTEAVGGKGSVHGTMQSSSRELANGATETTVQVEMEMSGRMVEFGRGMIRSVSRQLTKKFVSCAKKNLEAN
jgi:carbon monoxide dehydrogenase subunit G